MGLQRKCLFHWTGDLYDLVSCDFKFGVGFCKGLNCWCFRLPLLSVASSSFLSQSTAFQINNTIHIWSHTVSFCCVYTCFQQCQKQNKTHSPFLEDFLILFMNTLPSFYLNCCQFPFTDTIMLLNLIGYRVL